MTILFSATTRLESWLDATEYLLRFGNALNVILSISSPESDGPNALRAHDTLDEFYASENAMPLHTVAETIFPGWEYSKRGLRGVYEIYETEYDALRKGAPGKWGTYAHRLIRRRTGNGQMINPLERLIEKMRLCQQGRGIYKACYEIGIAEGEYDMPLYNTADDQNRWRGLPCLSHLSFKLFNDGVHLTAVYRSHDYRHKVPGNLLGLARLQACVAHEVGLSIGTLVVHSTYAWVPGSKGRLQEVIKDLRGSLAKGIDV
jgi:thymidylate synthase